MTETDDCIKKIEMPDQCENFFVKALVSKNNSTCENAVSQTLYGTSMICYYYGVVWQKSKVAF